MADSDNRDGLIHIQPPGHAARLVVVPDNRGQPVRFMVHTSYFKVRHRTPGESAL